MHFPNDLNQSYISSGHYINFLWMKIHFVVFIDHYMTARHSSKGTKFKFPIIILSLLHCLTKKDYYTIIQKRISLIQTTENRITTSMLPVAVQKDVQDILHFLLNREFCDIDPKQTVYIPHCNIQPVNKTLSQYNRTSELTDISHKQTSSPFTETLVIVPVTSKPQYLFKFL